jgi:hypothetical protein
MQEQYNNRDSYREQEQSDTYLKYTFNNMKLIQLSESTKCICIHCKDEFMSSDIDKVIDKYEHTALCPYCRFDTVIPHILIVPREDQIMKWSNHHNRSNDKSMKEKNDRLTKIRLAETKNGRIARLQKKALLILKQQTDVNKYLDKPEYLAYVTNNYAAMQCSDKCYCLSCKTECNADEVTLYTQMYDNSAICPKCHLDMIVPSFLVGEFDKNKLDEWANIACN